MARRPETSRNGLLWAGRSRLVAGAKIILPLVALTLLSTMFLISDRAAPEDAIPYAEVDVVERAREPKLTGAEYSGVTEDGTALALRASEAVPKGGDGAHASDLALVWQTREGLRADLVADQAQSLPGEGRIALSGDVTMTTSTGYRITTDRLLARTDQSVINAPDEVRAAAPFGNLTAGSLQLDRPAPDAPHVLDFTGGVRLIYRPEE